MPSGPEVCPIALALPVGPEWRSCDGQGAERPRSNTRVRMLRSESWQRRMGLPETALMGAVMGLGVRALP